MAFPTIPTAAAGRLSSNVQADTTATRTFPTLTGMTHDAGDLLIAIVVAYQTTATANAAFSGWTAGWTEFIDQSSSSSMAIGAAYKWSTGSETGQITVTQAATITGHAAMILMAIPGANAATPPTATGKSDGTTAAPNPVSLNPAGWDAEDTLWICVAASGETSTTGAFTGIDGAPINYTDEVRTGITADVVGGVEGAVSFRQLNAAAEDVGSPNVDISNARSSALVIAVRPAPAPTATTVARVSLASSGTPTSQTAHSIKARARKTSGTGTVTLKAALYESTNNRSGDLESSALTTSLAEYTLAIADANAANITDYSDLEIRFWGASSSADIVDVEIADIWLETPAAAAGSNALAGTVAAVSTVTGATTVDRPLTGTVAAASTATGTLTVTEPGVNLAGTVGAASTVSGSVTVTAALTGTVAAQSTTASAIIVRAALTGTTQAASIVTGALTIASPLAGTIAAISSVTGGLQVIKNLAGTIQATSTVSGALTNTPPGGIALAGIVAGASTTTGALTALAALAGTIGATSTVTGTLTVQAAGQNNLAGTVAATSTVAGTITVIRPLIGTVTGQSSVAGSLTVPIPLSGTIAAVSISTGTLTIRYPLTGTIAATSTTTGGIVVYRPLTGTIPATSTLAGTLTNLGPITEVGVLEAATTISFTAHRTAVSSTEATLTTVTE